jgi:outer membrane protein TolC
MKFNRFFMFVFLSLLFLPMTSPLPVLAEDGQPVQLSLADSITIALENNVDIRIEKQNAEIKKESVIKSEAGFDPTFSVDAAYADTETSATDAKVASSEIALQQTFKTGTSYSIGMTTEQTDPDDSSDTVSYESGLALTITQPLLKNRGTEVNTAAIVIAQRNRDISQSQLNAKVTDIVSSVQKKYWELLEARQIFEADQYSLQLANDLVEDNKKKVEVGTLAQLDVLQAQATAASRAVTIISDEQSIRDLEDDLRDLLNPPQNNPIWQAEIILLTQPEQDRNEIDLDEKIVTALKNREELKQLKQTLSIRNISVKSTQNQLLPTLDLQAGISVTTGEESFSESWNLQNADDHNYSIGLSLEYPLGNRAAESDYNTAVLEQKQTRYSVNKYENSIKTEVRQAVRAVDSAYKRITATEVAERLAREQLNNEKRKYDEGLSTNFQVLDYQDQLASSLSDSTKAKVDYQNALDVLDYTVGSTLSRHHIKIE